MSIKFKKLNNSIVKCKSCPRLIKFSKKISLEKRKKNTNYNYWSYRYFCSISIINYFMSFENNFF